MTTTFNIQKADDLAKQSQWLELSNLLKDTFTIIKNTTTRQITFHESHLDYLCKLFCDNFENDGTDVSYNVFLLDVIRSLRNCTTNTEAQNYLVNKTSFLNNVNRYFQRILLENEKNNVNIKIILQFLINLVVCNHFTSLAISETMYNSLQECLEKNICSYELSALIYNLHLQKVILNFNNSLYQRIIERYSSEEDNEYLHFLLESFLYYTDFWNLFAKLKIEHRLLLLTILRDLQLNNKLDKLPLNSVSVLSKCFSNFGSVVFQTVSCNPDTMEPYEISVILDILASLCSEDMYLNILQNDRNILINAGAILINIHKLGKESDNYFTSVEKLSEVREPPEVMQQHPAFAFKAALVRLIGNLCWKNKSIQDLVREAELIPVLLDCCNIDARNPLIMQWVILAVRNLCENNMQNQSIIAGLHKEGTVSSSILHEMGMTLHDNGSEKLRIVPLDSLRKK